MKTVHLHALMLIIVSNCYFHTRTTFGLISALICFATFLWSYERQKGENNES